MHRRELLRLGGAALATTATAGCSSVGGSVSDKTVSMTTDFAFGPERVSVKGGATVTWVNDSEVGHTVTAYEDGIPVDADYFASGGFESERAARNDVSGGLIAAGETFDHTFETPGTYEYVCIPHESSEMVGTVVVR
jgi:plastocyanin